MLRVLGLGLRAFGVWPAGLPALSGTTGSGEGTAKRA